MIFTDFYFYTIILNGLCLTFERGSKLCSKAYENWAQKVSWHYCWLLIPQKVMFFFQLQYFQTCIWKSLWCFCVVQWSHPVASWVNHICVFPMDIWGSLLQEFLLIYYDSLESNSIAGKQYMSTFTSRFVPKRPWLIKKKVWTIHEMNSKEVMNPPWRQS